MTSPVLSRRQIFARTLALGITLEFAGAQAFADPLAAGRKLVVIICRGGQDGLSVSPPVGDPAYAALRGPIAIPGFGQPDGALKLDDTFGLHPALKATHALAMKGEARIAPAIATPDRERSHFEAQDVLENGGTVAYGATSGWLNRALGAMGPKSGVKAISVAATAPLILRGPVETASWSPGGGAQPDHRLPGILQDLYANDPVLGPALATGLATQSMAKSASAAVTDEMAAMAPESTMTGEGPAYRPGAPTRQGVAEARKLGLTLAAFMTAPDGKQVAAVSVDNFDTHANQGASQGQLATRLAYLDAFIDGLHAGLGPAWADTMVVTATEFGRTARVNGTRGTDHGTASTALVLGGALRKGGIIGDWPTLKTASLFENRDTAPTREMRGLFKGVLRDHLGIDRAALDALVFPGSATIPPAANLTA
jgi:uncharacterized protein (DUF1501 family)